jgi:hypothetical protein
MYLRQCKQCDFLFRADYKTKICQDCKAKNKEVKQQKCLEKHNGEGYAYQRRLKALRTQTLNTSSTKNI